MKQIYPEQNKYFYLDKNYNLIHSIKGKVDYILKEPLSYMGDTLRGECNIYKSGAMIRKNDWGSVEVIFYNNNGEKLFDIGFNTRTGGDVLNFVFNEGIFVEKYNSDGKAEKTAFFFYDGRIETPFDFKKLYQNKNDYSKGE